MTDTNLPERGLVFWPVGSGDSTTVVVDGEHVLQIDIRDMAQADDPGALVAPVVQRLVEQLPKRGGRPYLAAFGLTHADKDHCTGFADLAEQVLIGELWVTPRLWRELGEGESAVCEDAHVLHAEAERRVAATLRAAARGEQPASGDRILIVGYDSDHDDHAYAALPDEYHTGPGHLITKIDGEDLSAVFGAFVHGPFADDCDGERNGTSLALQITLTEPGGGCGRALLLGDLEHDGVMQFFGVTEANGRAEHLAWDLLLAPHHCSKYVMYVDGVFQHDVMDAFAAYARSGARVVASSRAIPGRNDSGDNPPHAVARYRYLEIVARPELFLCTAEWPSAEQPRPIAFGVGADGLVLLEPTRLDLAEQEVGAQQSLTKAAAVLAGLAAPFAVETLRRWRARRPGSATAPSAIPGLVRAKEGVQASRGPNAAPRHPIGHGLR